MMTVPNELPPYLRLHTEDLTDEKVAPAHPIQAHDELLRTFTTLTGWTLQARPAQSKDRSEDSPHRGNPARGRARMEYVVDDMSPELPPGQPAANRVQSEELIGVINAIIGELDQTRDALRYREAELATAIPVIPAGDDVDHLAIRLEAILRGAADSVDADAAAIYLLDDATSELKLRSSWGLPDDRLIEAARPLRGAVADLEALVGHAVVLEDTRILSHWNAPEDFPSALCVPLSSATTPLGTLWIFSRRSRDFSSKQTEMIEIVGGRIVAELEREAILANGIDVRQHERQLALASSWQEDRLPNIQPVIDDLSISGWARQSDKVGGDFYDWNVLCDGRLAIALGDAQGATIESGMTAAAVHASSRALSMHRTEPSELMMGVNDTMWSGGLGDQFASMFYGVLNPSDWSLQFCRSGSVIAYLVSEHDVATFDDERPMLGVEPDYHFPPTEAILEPGQALIVLSEGMRQALWDSGVSDKQDGMTEFLQRHLAAGCENLVGLLKQVTDRKSSDSIMFDRAALVVEHRS